MAIENIQVAGNHSNHDGRAREIVNDNGVAKDIVFNRVVTETVTRKFNVLLIT